MQELHLLNEKLDELLKRYSALQAENTRLKGTVAQQTKTIENLNGKLSDLERNMAGAQLGKGILSDKENENMRKQLDSVIGEIDKILMTLNE